MQALLAPIIAGAGGATGVALGAQAASGIFGGISSASKAAGEKKAAETNAYIGRTRAIQTDTDARRGLEGELSDMRAVLSANGQRPNVGTLAVFNAARKTRGRERRIEYGNRMSEAADYKQQARNIRPGLALAGGLIKAAPSLFDLYDYTRNR